LSFHEQQTSLSNLKNESLNFYQDFLKKDKELTSKANDYERMLETKNKKISQLEEELQSIKRDKDHKENSYAENLKETLKKKRS